MLYDPDDPSRVVLSTTPGYQGSFGEALLVVGVLFLAVSLVLLILAPLGIL